MKPKMKPCDLGGRHKWTWVKNVDMFTQSASQARIFKRGVYRCDCGLRKYGAARLEVGP